MLCEESNVKENKSLAKIMGMDCFCKQNVIFSPWVQCTIGVT